MFFIFQKALYLNFLVSLPYFFFSSADMPYPAQCGLQDPATRYFEDIIDLHHDLMMFMLMGIVFVLYMLVATLIEFKDNEGVTLPPQDIRHNTFIEVVWTIIPALILISIAVPSFILLYSMEENFDASINLKILGNQWYWTYECEDLMYPVGTRKYNFTSFREKLKYCGHKRSKLRHRIGLSSFLKHSVFKTSRYSFDAVMLTEDEVLASKGRSVRLLSTDNVLVLPVKIPVRCTVTATDVIHSWTVPSFGVKLDACPGRLNTVVFTVKRIGIFYGQCSEICGVKHAFMPIQVNVVRAKTFLNHVVHSL